MKPLLLDLFCGAGGAAVGYHRAGFDVVGVDNRLQPNYPFEFHQADALEHLATHAHDLDVVHASPPCQRYSAMSSCRPGLADDYLDLVNATRALLQATGLPWVIENVPGSGLPPQRTLGGAEGILLCGQMFGRKLYRHRLFESNMPLTGDQPPHPRHTTPGGRAGHWREGEIVSVSGNCAPISLSREAMGIDWMNSNELSEAIPPAYTEYIGAQLLAHMCEVSQHG